MMASTAAVWMPTAGRQSLWVSGTRQRRLSLGLLVSYWLLLGMKTPSGR